MDRLAAKYTSLKRQPLAMRESLSASILRITVDKLSGVGPWINESAAADVLKAAAEQVNGPTLCRGGTVRHVVAHLGTSVDVPLPWFMFNIARAAGTARSPTGLTSSALAGATHFVSAVGLRSRVL